MAVLVPVPMVIVPDALISNAPPPAPPAPAPLPPVPPAQPPLRGWRFVPLLTAPPAAADPPAPLPPAVPKPPPPPPAPPLLWLVPVEPLQLAAMLPPAPGVVMFAPASILPPES